MKTAENNNMFYRGMKLVTKCVSNVPKVMNACATLFADERQQKGAPKVGACPGKLCGSTPPPEIGRQQVTYPVNRGQALPKDR